jgi:hypothetical protein
VGEHNTEIYSKLLGYPTEQVMLLKQAGVI